MLNKDKLASLVHELPNPRIAVTIHSLTTHVTYADSSVYFYQNVWYIDKTNNLYVLFNDVHLHLTFLSSHFSCVIPFTTIQFSPVMSRFFMRITECNSF